MIPGSIGRYPNLELMDYQVVQYIRRDAKLVEKFNKVKEEIQGIVRLDFSVEVFQQVWGATNTGFDVDMKGSPQMGGSMLTEAFTVVFHEIVTDSYFVFIDNRLCYVVDNANDKFLSDLKEHNLGSRSFAMREY